MALAESAVRVQRALQKRSKMAPSAFCSQAREVGVSVAGVEAEALTHRLRRRVLLEDADVRATGSPEEPPLGDMAADQAAVALPSGVRKGGGAVKTEPVAVKNGKRDRYHAAGGVSLGVGAGLGYALHDRACRPELGRSAAAIDRPSRLQPLGRRGVAHDDVIVIAKGGHLGECCGEDERAIVLAIATLTDRFSEV
jgi:hypothetical protein